MYLDKLGFFKKKTALENQQLKTNLNQLTTNLKNNILKKMLLSYLQQQLHFLTISAASTKTVTKQKHLLSRLKYTMQKRRAKKRVILMHRHKVPSVEINHQRPCHQNIQTERDRMMSLVPEKPSIGLNNRKEKRRHGARWGF